ncbi:MAG: pseudouridine synthase, partial [Opitutaceae bacterium]
MTAIAFHKPYGVLSQFTPEPGSAWKTLAEFGFPSRIYPVGRLDVDSEGLFILSDEPGLNAALLHPSRRHPREYWAQVEGLPDKPALAKLRTGIRLAGKRTLPARAWLMDAPRPLPPRDPPIRIRRSVPDHWLALELIEGRNRQVRRMTAAVGHPTLRLVRARMGHLCLTDLGLAPGQWRALSEPER